MDEPCFGVEDILGVTANGLDFWHCSLAAASLELMLCYATMPKWYGGLARTLGRKLSVVRSAHSLSTAERLVHLFPQISCVCLVEDSLHRVGK